LFWNEKIQEICFQTRFKYAMEMTFRYPVYHLILHWKRRLANPRRDDVSLPRISFNSTLESLPLQLCSQPLTGNSFAIDRLGMEPLPVSCALDLIPSSLFFGNDDCIGCLDGGVSVTPKLTLWSQTHVLIWRC
jgi:hypothetical protein